MRTGLCEYDPTMVLLDAVVQVPGRPQFGASGQQAALSHLAYCTMRCCTAIEGDRVRRPTFRAGLPLEESLRRGYVSCPAEPEVDSVPRLVNHPIEIDPFSAHLNIGLIERATIGRRICQNGSSA